MVHWIGQTSQRGTARAVDWSHGRGLRTGQPRIQAHLHIHANMHWGGRERTAFSHKREAGFAKIEFL